MPCSPVPPPLLFLILLLLSSCNSKETDDLERANESGTGNAKEKSHSVNLLFERTLGDLQGQQRHPSPGRAPGGQAGVSRRCLEPSASARREATGTLRGDSQAEARVGGCSLSSLSVQTGNPGVLARGQVRSRQETGGQGSPADQSPALAALQRHNKGFLIQAGPKCPSHSPGNSCLMKETGFGGKLLTAHLHDPWRLRL